MGEQQGGVGYEKDTRRVVYRQRPAFYDIEVLALKLLRQHQVARVVKLVDVVVAPNDDRYLAYN